MVISRGKVPYTITNGSFGELGLINQYFPEIGVSLDTIDQIEAEQTGRLNLRHVLARFEELVSLLGHDRVIVHTVNYGQDLRALNDYLKSRGVTRHIIQPLQTKEDYRHRYMSLLPKREFEYRYACSYIEKRTMRFFNIEGLELPCCYIKDVSRFTNLEDMKSAFAKQRVPAVCEGCRLITV